MIQTMWISILKGFIQQQIGTCQEKTARIGHNRFQCQSNFVKDAGEECLGGIKRIK